MNNTTYNRIYYDTGQLVYNHSELDVIPTYPMLLGTAEDALEVLKKIELIH